ncbi:MAG: cytochrome b/b6 domain-containing protein [Chloroflexi bacterium]|nr:cytochrome b/b6 domain-containing protein [Chloroflexota bacterium]MCL5074700.1 cytochrome b/b6 domain-containing protein [Chloroflexota bacterium]
MAISSNEAVMNVPQPAVGKVREVIVGRAVSREIVRFDVHQRAQHLMMMVSLLLLVFTGLPQKFYTLSVSQWLIGVWGGLDSARMIHRSAAVVMILACVYHLAYLIYGIVVLKRPFPVWMIPSPEDFRDFFQNTAYCLGLAKEKPKFDRYSYFEKFDYWAVFWGVPIMVGTGLILWFPLIAVRFLPGVVVPIAAIAHSDEAVLAAGWIFVIHLYNAHLAPHIFPFNKSIFTGCVTEERYKREHPLEYERLLKVAEAPREAQEEQVQGEG